MTEPTDNNSDPWIIWANELQAIAQTGLHYTDNVFEIIRYERIRDIAAEILALHASQPKELVQWTFNREWGYATPKMEVRALVFKEDKILLVQELDKSWSVPGGFVDVNASLKPMVEKEVFEESGFKVNAVQLLACLDSRKHNPGHYWPHIYKFLFHCELVGGAAQTSVETLAVDFFPLDNLPPLSLCRITPKEIHEGLAKIQQRDQVTLVD